MYPNKGQPSNPMVPLPQQEHSWNDNNLTGYFVGFWNEFLQFPTTLNTIEPRYGWNLFEFSCSTFFSQLAQPTDVFSLTNEMYRIWVCVFPKLPILSFVASSVTYRRWTKYSNLEEKIGRTPLSPNVKVKQSVRDMSCCGVWFLLSTPLNPWKKKTTLKFGVGAGDKVVQGLNILSIYGMSFLGRLTMCGEHSIESYCPNVHRCWNNRLRWVQGGRPDW